MLKSIQHSTWHSRNRKFLREAARGMVEQLIKFFVVFFVVVEPISLIPLFAGLTEGASDSYN